jgi:hypothetical protein
LTRSASDVAWHPTKPNIIAASTLNSKINLWNVDLTSRTRDNALQSLEGHTRSANRVKWQLQSAAALLASACGAGVSACGTGGNGLATESATAVTAMDSAAAVPEAALITATLAIDPATKTPAAAETMAIIVPRFMASSY